MKRIFLDSNIFLRFLIKDNRQMAKETKALFEAIEKGKIKAETDLIILVEIIWVLSSFFKIDREKIFEYISLLLKLKNFIIKDEEIISQALDFYRKTSVDFIDAFCASFVLRKKINFLCSYDKDFDKIKGVKRVTPKDLI